MAKIDTSNIDGYETMSAEEKLAALENFEYEDNATKLEQIKASFDRASKEAADWKKKHNQLLSDDERKRQESDEAFKEMQKELEDLKREKQVSQNKAAALSIGIDDKNAETISVAISNGEFEKVFEAFGKFLQTHDHEIEVGLMQDTPRTPGSDGADVMTLEQFKKLTPKERYEFSTKNPDEYKKLYGGN